MREMKDSGIEWIGEIPKDWKKSKISQIYKLRTTKVSDRDYMPLSVTKNGIVPQLDSAAKTNAHDDRKLVEIGDFVINSRSDRRGSCGISKYNGSVSLINTVIKPNNIMCPNYYNWLFHTVQFADEFYKWGHGIVNDLWTTNWQDMKNINIPVPQLEEQQKIADYLDDKVGEINKVISETKETIEKYKEYKQAIITETVTKGLNPNEEMKDSGIEHIGLIPLFWEVKKIKYILQENGERTKNGEEEPLSMSQKYGLIPTKDMDMIPNIASSFKNCKIVKKNDLVFNKLKAHLGVFARSNYDGLVSPDYAVYQQKSNDSMLFLEYLFKTPQYISQFIKYSRGVAQGLMRLYTEELFNIYIAIPSFYEQEEILNYLTNKCSKIDTIIKDKEDLITKLEEYKKSLIYEAVTGKIDIQ